MEVALKPASWGDLNRRARSALVGARVWNIGSWKSLIKPPHIGTKKNLKHLGCVFLLWQKRICIIYLYIYMYIYNIYGSIYIYYGLLWLYTSNSHLSLEKTSSFSILFESWRQVVRRSSSFVLRERVDFVLRTWSGSWSSRTCFVTCTYFDYWDFHGFPMKWSGLSKVLIW